MMNSLLGYDFILLFKKKVGMGFSVKIDTIFISFIVYVMDYPLKKILTLNG